MIELTIHDDLPGAVISKDIYGHFAEHLGRCVEEGLWVGADSPIPNTRGIRNDVVEALRRIQIPVLRWPGGCFADEYHWRDGVGPRDTRVPMVNTHWGGVAETNQFGTHEFFDLCEQLGTDPYVNGNVGSGTVREMQEWVEYITYDGSSPMADLRRANGREQPWPLPFFGVGNENWGCGGSMRPEYYADLFRRYGTYVRDFSGNHIAKIACGPNDADYQWTETLMREASAHMQALSLHYYTVFWQSKQAATGFGVSDWFATLEKALVMDDLLHRHSEIMDRYDPEKRVALIVDEWGTWYDVEPGTNAGFLYQQNTIRDALVAGVTLNLFNAHADRVRMANIAQMVNVLQALILTDGPRMILTPTYHVFELYKVHQNSHLLPVTVSDIGTYTLGDRTLPQLSVSASRDAAGRVQLTACNLHPHDAASIRVRLSASDLAAVEGAVLSASQMDAHNTFDAPDHVRPTALSTELTDGSLTANLPPCPFPD